MREKIIVLAINTYTQKLWERNDVSLSEQEVKQILKEVGLYTVDDRKMANFEFIITLYEEAQKTTEIESLNAAILTRLKERKYMTEYVVFNLLKERNLTKDYHLKVLHQYMNNSIQAQDRKSRRTDILNYTVELVSYYEASSENGVWTLELIKQEIKRILDTFYPDLGFKEYAIKKSIMKKLVAKTYTLKQFEECYHESHEVFGNYLKVYMPSQKEDHKEIQSEISLEDSLESLLNEMGLGEQETNEDVQEQACIKQQVEETNDVQILLEEDLQNPIGNRVSWEEAEKKAFLQHMNEMARIMGYELHKVGDRVMPEAYYQTLITDQESAKADIWRNLARVDRQCVLSELYNTYNQIQHISLANVEATLGNFFMMLSLEGIEVDEEGISVGESVRVSTKDTLKTFVFEQPTQKEGEVEGTLLYKGWKYKGKSIMPKVIKVKEEV